MGRVASGPVSTPVIYSLRVAVWDEQGHIVATANQFKDLSSFVGPIHSPGQALGLVRSYTGYPDFLMFDDSLLEIDPDASYLRFPKSLAGTLAPPQVERTNDGGFRIMRNLIRYRGNGRASSVFRSSEIVGPDGRYELNIGTIYPNTNRSIRIHLPE